VGAGAPQVDKLRAFYNHPGFVDPMVTNLRVALAGIPDGRRAAAHVVFTAHSVPTAMAEGSAYVAQLQEASRLVAAGAAPGLPWELVFQSRSGPPSVPWLEPDVNDHLADLARRGVRDVAVVPIGFVSDHMEVRFDLDVEAARTAGELGLHLVRAATVGNHPRFAAMVRELVEERIAAEPVRLALGLDGPSHDVCALDCCPAPARRPAPAEAGAGTAPAPAGVAPRA
jgi:ferrochelatase